MKFSFQYNICILSRVSNAIITDFMFIKVMLFIILIKQYCHLIVFLFYMYYERNNCAILPPSQERPEMQRRANVRG
jgi:hypothetical protein